MAKECPRENCFVPEVGCDLGFDNLDLCPALKGVVRHTQDFGEVGDEILLPWSGSALGLADVGFITGRSKPIVIGVVGAQKAGKTTLLAALYLLLGRGARLPGRSFAGSYSLLGWEALAGAMRWGPGTRPSFPPHTSSRGGRAPGMLHLSLRNSLGQIKDFLFTDAPGEWFSRWAVNRDDVEAQGARWVAHNADTFLLVADKAALAGPDMGSARGELQRLANRLGGELAGRSVALVWSKDDVGITDAMEASIRQSATRAMPGLAEFKVSVLARTDQGTPNEAEFLRLFAWALAAKRPKASLAKPSVADYDPLLIFGAS
jgi:Double-GTPase 2